MFVGSSTILINFIISTILTVIISVILSVIEPIRISIIIPMIRIIPVFFSIFILITPIFGDEFLHHSSQT